MFTSLLLILASITAATFAADDIVSLLEKKGPKMREIVAKPTISRELKLPHLPINSRQIEFLIDHPRVSLALAHLYAPSLDPYDIEVRPDRVIHIHDPAGLAGNAELIDARPGRRVYLITGYFDIFKMRFNGQMVLMTVYSEQVEDAAVSVESTTTAYIKVNSSFAGIFARLADFLFPHKVDERIGRLLHAAQTVAVAIHTDPTDAYRKLRVSREVSTEELKDFEEMFLRGYPGTLTQGARFLGGSAHRSRRAARNMTHSFFSKDGTLSMAYYSLKIVNTGSFPQEG